MDILSKITELRKARNWSEYQLAAYSGLTQSTISSWYRKKMVPSIPSLKKICNAFEISLSQFFLEEEGCAVYLTSRQIDLIHLSNKLSPEQFEAMLSFLRTL